jgi:hypothetical protein
MRILVGHVSLTIPQREKKRYDHLFVFYMTGMCHMYMTTTLHYFWTIILGSSNMKPDMKVVGHVKALKTDTVVKTPS